MSLARHLCRSYRTAGRPAPAAATNEAQPPCGPWKRPVWRLVLTQDDLLIWINRALEERTQGLFSALPLTSLSLLGIRRVTSRLPHAGSRTL